MAEKRKHARMDAGYEVFLTYQGHTSMAQARDISPHGIGIYTNQSLNPKDPVELSINLGQGGLNLSLSGSVRYCIENPDRVSKPYPFLAGVEFSEESKEDFPFMEVRGDIRYYKASHSLAIDSEAETCYRLICDFERYPEWAGVLDRVEVLERYPDGRAQRVEFEVNLFIRKVRYLLDYSYDDDNLCLSWVSAGGDILSIVGRYSFRALRDKETSSNYELDISLDFFLPDRIVRYFSAIVMRKTMKEFKTFVEKNASSAN